MKINILFDITDKPFGGGNQFLRNLRNEFKRKNVYVNDVKDADVVLFNSHHKFNMVVELRTEFQNKKFIHRVDGPISLYNPPHDQRDDLVNILSRFSDGTVFQSDWSRDQNFLVNKNFSEKPHVVIHNAADVNVKTVGRIRNDNRIHLISTSFSNNMNKGFDCYNYLDENLDFSKYEYTFVGNSPIKFKNIKYIPPMQTQDLLLELIYNDIFITASQNDPCSNSLIEALTCGLPAVALNSGGHPELVKNGGLLFDNKYDVIDKINMVSDKIDYYQDQIEFLNIEDVAQQYYNFFKMV